MLSKEICQKCMGKKSPWISRGGERWYRSDEDRWRNGVINCCEFNWIVISIDEDPPKSCPYILEHIMKEDEKA